MEAHVQAVDADIREAEVVQKRNTQLDSDLARSGSCVRNHSPSFASKLETLEIRVLLHRGQILDWKQRHEIRVSTSIMNRILLSSL